MEQLEYNNETLAQATNVQEEVETICRWAAARAAGIAALPSFTYAGLLANDVYMVSRIAQAYGVCPAKEGGPWWQRCSSLSVYHRANSDSSCASSSSHHLRRW